MPGEPPGSGGPLDPAGLVGRAAEAAAIRRMLDGASLVTVTGLPGVGKTAVSLATAHTAGPGFADGSLLLRLDTLRDEALLPHTIGAALRLPDQYTRSRLDVLVDQLRDRHLLLILDTCEHLLGACAALVAALLPPCPRCRSWRPAGNRSGCRARRRRQSARCGWRTRWSCSADVRRRPGPRSRRSTGPPWPRSACSWTSCRWPSSWQRPNWPGSAGTSRQRRRWPSCSPGWRPVIPAWTAAPARAAPARPTSARAASARANPDGTGRCGPRSAGATSCVPRPSACCGPGCRCSLARSARGTPWTCAPATSCPPTRSRPA